MFFENNFLTLDLVHSIQSQKNDQIVFSRANNLIVFTLTVDFKLKLIIQNAHQSCFYEGIKDNKIIKSDDNNK